LFELTGALGLAVDGDPKWRAFALDGYLFIALIYWIGCFAMSRYSRALERAT
jgi:general L-amino acid transport system permease protein